MMSFARRVVSRVRWYEVAPELVLAGGLSVFAVTEPHAAASAFKSSRALVLMGVVAVGWVIARTVTFAYMPRRALRFVLFAVAALAILKVVVLPAYNDHTVVETLAARPVSTASVPPAAAVTVPVEPVKIRAGSLAGIDHRASGTVNVYRQPDGRVVVGLEDFDIQPGPAYAVYLVEGPARDDKHGGTRLAALRGNRGTQFYDAPNAIDLSSGQWTVLVWCETFDVPVANATPIPL